MQMTHKVMLRHASLFSILFLSFHLTQDALHARVGTTAAGSGNIVGAAILFVMLAGTLLLAEHWSGLIVMLFVSIAAAGMPVLHLTNGADLTKHAAAFFFLWTLIALGVSGALGAILVGLEARRLWSERRVGSSRIN